MTPNQSLPTNKAHIIPVTGVKSGTVAIAAASSPRATTIISTAQRKRDNGKHFYSIFEERKNILHFQS